MASDIRALGFNRCDARDGSPAGGDAASPGVKHGHEDHDREVLMAKPFNGDINLLADALDLPDRACSS
jgi:hypothetical protein